MLDVAFINENTLGHASYLLPFVRHYRERPELGIRPHVIDAVPLPAHLKWFGEFFIRGLRRWNLDFGITRQRLAASRNVREQLDAMRLRHPIQAVVVNTQSVGLALTDLDRAVKLLVCLDATFEQLGRSLWFAPNRLSKLFGPLTLWPLYSGEGRLFARADQLLPWSEGVRRSLLEEYRISSDRVAVLPPSVRLEPERESRPAQTLRQILFLGGDFRRKGGALLLECFCRYLTGRYELHLVTHSPVESVPGVFVHRGIQPHSSEWRERWRQADVFVFPSTLETFGIVLLEALTFQVPVVSSSVGAAREILADGRAGVLLQRLDARSLAEAIENTFLDQAATRVRVSEGAGQIERCFHLEANARRLASLLQSPNPAPCTQLRGPPLRLR